MKLHLNLSLRRALMAAMAVACALSSTTVTAGVVDERYDLQYYLDFSYNKGMFAAGATNISVFYKDGTAIPNNTIPLMPNLDSYVRVGHTTTLPLEGTILESYGGAGLISAQFVYGAAHVYQQNNEAETAFFLSENGSWSTAYEEANLNTFGADSGIQRLTKLVTEVAYTPMADDAFMQNMSTNSSWLYRLGNGGTWCTTGESISTGSNALGGIINASSITNNGGDWCLTGWHRENDIAGDSRTPLDIGMYYGDSGSPIYAWDEASESFLFVGAMYAGSVTTGYDNFFKAQFYPVKAQELIDNYTVNAEFSGTDTILWGASDAATGKGTLTQGSGTAVDYTGKGTDNSLGDSLGLTFSTDDTTNVQNLQLQGNVNMGAGALTFENGKWRITETDDNNFSLSSAGFDISKGAEVTWELTGVSGQEIRKVGEGILTVAGSGDNAASLVVGGGTTVYNITRDENGNITGCTLGNAGETRLNRTDGYAASSVRLEGGVAILVLMADNQFKTNSVAGDTFSFGNAGGLLNLNGHDLSWGVINQNGSGTGARIGNFTPSGENTPGLATFTYTGTGTFEGSFMDEGSGEGKAQLAVVYNNTDGGTWKLTGQSNNAGGYTVEAGTMVLEGTNTPHVRTTDRGDWTYASIVTSGVTVKSGASFQLSHHALMNGDVTVESGGSFILNQTVNAASESVSGSLRQDMASLGITSLVGNVTLNGAATMTVNTESSVTTTMQGNITGDTSGSSFASFTKTGSGNFVVNGQMGIPRGTVEQGGLIVKDATNFLSTWSRWTIKEEGFLAVQGLDGQSLASCIDSSSTGVLALTIDQSAEINLTNITDKLYIGAYGDTPITYGTAGADLSANDDGQWLLGGGTGTLQVDFRLTGANDLIIGNEWSSGTVHLTNTANDFTGDIYIKGTGNMLTYVDGALGDARVALSYGNTLALNDVNQLSILKDGAKGVLAVSQSQDIDLSGKEVALGANGAVTYTGELTVDDTYRFGGKGDLTLDTELSSVDKMELDGQGNTGSSVTFARKDAYVGDIVVGGGLHLDSANSAGDIALHVGHAEALASAASVELQKGATLHTDGRDSLVVNNLSALAGSSIQNKGETASHLQLHVDENISTTIADGVLLNANNNAALSLIKTGKGTVTMGVNATWSGGLTITEGTVAASLSSNGTYNSVGGIGTADNTIYVDKDGTLSMKGAIRTGRALGGTEMVQQVMGNGTIEFSSGGSAFFSTQSSSFDGTVRLAGNTRVYLGSNLDYNGSGVGKNTLSSVQDATIEVTSGSQVRITSTLYKQSTAHMSSYSDFIISGSGFAGSYATNSGVSDIYQLDRLTSGALAIDLGSTVYGNVTLADDATISSSSFGSLGASKTSEGYGTKGHLGGTVRGRILGEGKTLTIAGNESMTFTSDSANTFGNLVISNGNGNNDDKFALQLNGGAARSQVSTALGTGEVTLNDGLILRLAGAGTADMSDVVYTYANNVSAGAGATLQSYNITNQLTGTVSMSGDSLNLATANGGVLELAGGISGSGTLNVGANSVIILGSAAETLSRSTTPQFSGSVVAAAGADITLASSAVVSDTTAFTGTDSLTLRFGGTDDYTLGGITMNASSEDVTSVLTLNFDFTNVPDAADATTWATLFSDISAGETTVELSLNMFNDIEQGTYTLATGSFSGPFELADTLNNRLALVQRDGSLILTVDADNRLYWSASAANQSWNTSDLNWYQQSSAGNVAFTANAHVVLDDSGAVGSSAESRETITLATDQTVGTLVAKDENAYYEVTGEATLSGDKLAVGEQADLKLSTTTASFTNGVQVDNASLQVSGTALTANVSATNGADFALSNGATLNGNLDIADAEAIVRGATVQGNLGLSGTAQVQMEAAQISGSVTSDGGTMTLSSAQLTGNLSNGENSLNSTSLTILGGSVTSDATLRMDSLRLQDGSLRINAAADIGTLGIAAGKTVTLWNATPSAGADKIIGTAELANSAVLETNDREAVTAATRIGTVKLTGESATIRDTYHSGFFEIHNLEGSASSTLNLVKNVTSNYVGVYALGDAVGTTESGSQFAGTILVKQQNASSDGSRDVVLLLNHESVAQNATINLASAAQATPKVALGINVESATIGGLRSGSDLASRAVVFSGAQASNSVWVDHSTDSAHTLIIDTASGSTHEFYGQVQNVNLVIDGEGTQKFLGSGENFTGSLSIQGGTAAFNASSFSMLNNASSLVVGSGTLDVSAIDFADDANVIRVNAGRSISFADNSIVAFGNMEADTEYGVFDISDGVLEGWSGLSASNFTIDGVKLSDMGRVVLNLDMAGGFSYTIEDGWDLVWNGGKEKQIWNQNESNQVWQTTRPDDYTGELVEMTVGYKNNDNVVFNSDADLELEGNIRVNDLTVAGGVSLKTNGNLTIVGTLNVGSNVSWSFSGDTSLSFTETQLKSFTAIEVGEGATLTMTDKVTEPNNTSDAFNNVSGAGNVVLNLSATDNGVGFNFEKITGDITVAIGRLQVNTSTFNAASGIYLATDDSQLVFNGQGTELKNDVVLEATTTIHANNQCSGAISGVISGSSGLTKAGAGALTFKQQNTYTGTTTISGGKIILDTAGAYRLLNNISGGTLEVASGTTLINNDMAVSSALVLTEGAAAEVSGSRKLKENITVNSGATLTFTGSGSDTLEYGDQAQYSKKLTVDGGVVDFGNTRQTMAKWEITLKNGASLRGVGGSYNYGTNTTVAAMDFNQDVVIKAESGDNTISATTRLRGGNSRTLTYNVSEGATLDVSGRIFGDNDTSPAGNVTKSGAGKATLSARTMLNKVTTVGGEIAVAYTGSDGNTIGILDGSSGGTAAGSLRLKKDAQLNVSSQLWGRSQSSVVLEQDAVLSHGSVQFSNKGTSDATLKTSGNNSQYSVAASDWSLTNGHLVSSSDSEVTLGTQLVNSSVENAGSGKLTVSNSGNSITDVYATAGNIDIEQLNAAVNLNLSELTVAESKTVGLYSGSGDSRVEANVTVTSHAKFGQGAVLNANLTLASGSTLSVAEGGLAMGSTLTLQKGLTLDDTTLGRVHALSVGESTALFTGVDGLTLDKTTYTSLTENDSMLANPYFTNLDSGNQYVLTYSGTDNGTLSIMAASVPEPTTTTLSLLALSALAMRRRRK